MDPSNSPDSILPPEAIQHYHQISEADRLTRPGGQVELVRTRELLLRYLPAPPATVLDVGGGAGVHALWLAQRNYQVHLIDAVQHHTEQAAEAARLQPEHPLAAIRTGDARRLDYDEGCADAVLLLGPLYHLTDRDDRLAALREARRVLRAGGVLLAVGISRFISTVDGLAGGLIDDGGFRDIIDGDLRDGQHRNPTEDPRYFTTSFFHHPDELQEEVEAAGFTLEALLAVEGPSRLLGDLEQRWSDPELRKWLLGLIRNVEQEPHLLGISTHLLAVGQT